MPMKFRLIFITIWLWCTKPNKKRVGLVPLRSFNKVEMFKSGLEQNQSCYLGMLYSYLEQNFDMDRVTVAGSDEHSMQVG